MEEIRRPIKTFSAWITTAAVVLGAFVGLLGMPSSSAVAAFPPGTIDPTTIPQWVNTLTSPPPVYVPTKVYDVQQNLIRHDYTVDMTAFDQQVLPAPLPKTHVWGYGGEAKDALTGAPKGYVRNSPAPSFEAIRGIPNQVRWQNKISEPYMFCVDPTLHWADPNGMGMPMAPFDPCPPGYSDAQSIAPLVPHLHGGEVESTSDGNPDTWFTFDGKTGPQYSSLPGALPGEAIFYYPNEQPATTLWYHDHGLGVTRINVMSGLAGFYMLRDPSDPVAPLLPSGQYEMPLAIQDRIFKTDGNFWYDNVGLNVDMHPYWMPEFFGNTIMVNGLVWPKMNVDQGWYRFRLLDGSNARFYSLSFKAQSPLFLNPLPFYVIGTDGGYLRAPAQLSSLTIAPGERYDILIDFSNVPAGTKILVSNSAKTPFPNGAAPGGTTTARILQLVVSGNAGFQKGVNLVASLPAPLNPTLAGAFPSLAPSTLSRTLVLWEVMGMLGPLEILLNGQKYAGDVSELPTLGTTEDWVIVNPTADTHPIHLHLTQFQLVSRQKFNVGKYAADWVALQTDNGVNNDFMPPWNLNYIPTELAVGPYLKGKPTPAQPQEQGWKDTVQMNPGEVTIIRVRFAPLDGTPKYPFDATSMPGYVWHCHIIEHEDNEMMRPYQVQPAI